MNPPKSTQPGTRLLAPRMVVGGAVRQPRNIQPLLARPAPMRAGIVQPSAVALQTGVMPGAVVFKTEDGQLQVVNVHPSSVQPVSTGLIGSRAQFRVPAPPGPAPVQQPQRLLQQIPARYTAAAANIRNRPPGGTLTSAGIVCVSQEPVMTPPQPLGVKIVPAPTVSAVTQQLAIQTGPMAVGGHDLAGGAPQMSPDTAKKKCRNFFSTLIRLASDQPENTAANVKRLIQGLIDDTMQPEEFTTKLERELSSNPQPCLIPFLRKSLPLLRHAMLTNELSIEGIRPPPRSALCMPPPSPPIARSLQKTAAARTVLPRTAAAQLQMIPQRALATAQMAGPVDLQGLLAQQQRLTASVCPAPGAGVTPGGGKSLLLARPPNFAAALPPTAGGVLPFKVPAPMSTAPQPKGSLCTSTGSISGGGGANTAKEKRSAGPALIDEDINDVATMGGVNVAEECRTILSTGPGDDGAEVQARSCKDENFLFTAALHKRISALAAVHGIDEVSDDVVALVSHATQERLKTFIEKLSVIAEHRQENARADPHYEVTQDVRQQLRFLDELERAEKRRHEQEEREMLLRAARSRMRAEDPEQLKLRQRARDLQRAEMEEARQREANTTALLAIGNRKRPMPVAAPGAVPGQQPTSYYAQVRRPRMKKVSPRDVLFLMEQERNKFHREFIYKAYMKY
ncbi:transcription initiation factor TFIID subunit 4-like [Dermacentor variabilis]|uniref:transcription initiation factor TFIID subunit 4-like n=1 Tax=Dermacentor variabilis TaxID=34621 RepID=UPI003F5B0CD9